MKLSQIVIKTERVDVRPEYFFEVRGVNFADIMTLMKDFAPHMRKIFDKFMESRKDGKAVDREEVQALFREAIAEFPDLIFHIIAIAADDLEGVDVLKRLPATVQLEALEKTLVLTMETDAELKKFQEIILRLIQMATGTFQKMGATSEALMAGYGKSVRA